MRDIDQQAAEAPTPLDLEAIETRVIRFHEEVDDVTEEQVARAGKIREWQTVKLLVSDGQALLAALRASMAESALRQGETERLRRQADGYARECHEVEQALGKALGYPWYKDDPDIFPGATGEDGVCTGVHTPAGIAAEAAGEIGRLRADLERANQSAENFRTSARLRQGRLDTAMAETDRLRDLLRRLTEKASLASMTLTHDCSRPGIPEELDALISEAQEETNKA